MYQKEPSNCERPNWLQSQISGRLALSERLSELPKITQLVSGRIEFRVHGSWLLSSCWPGMLIPTTRGTSKQCIHSGLAQETVTGIPGGRVRVLMSLTHIRPRLYHDTNTQYYTYKNHWTIYHDTRRYYLCNAHCTFSMGLALCWVLLYFHNQPLNKVTWAFYRWM